MVARVVQLVRVVSWSGWSGWSGGPGGPGGPGCQRGSGQLKRWFTWSKQSNFRFYACDTVTHRHGKVEQYSAWAESAISPQCHREKTRDHPGKLKQRFRCGIKVEVSKSCISSWDTPDKPILGLALVLLWGEKRWGGLYRDLWQLQKSLGNRH